MCVMRGTQASPTCNLGVCIFWDISALVHHVCLMYTYVASKTVKLNISVEERTHF